MVFRRLSEKSKDENSMTLDAPLGGHFENMFRSKWFQGLKCCLIMKTGRDVGGGDVLVHHVDPVLCVTSFIQGRLARLFNVAHK